MADTKPPFPLTPEFYDDNLKATDATWPDDPNVPDCLTSVPMGQTEAFA